MLPKLQPTAQPDPVYKTIRNRREYRAYIDARLDRFGGVEPQDAPQGYPCLLLDESESTPDRNWVLRFLYPDALEHFLESAGYRITRPGEDDPNNPDWNWMNDYEATVAVSEGLRPPFSACGGMVRHLKARRRDGKDGIPWDVLQHIKDEMLGKDCAAVEVFPPASELVNETNMRHLWEIPEESTPRMKR